MLDEMRVNDVELTSGEIGALENADEVVHLFAQLRYNVDNRRTISDIATLGLDSEDLRQQISRLELLAVDPVDEDIKIYLLEVRSVTAKLQNDIARRFRERPENALLVLTKDYETLDFVLLSRENRRSKSRGKPLQQVIRPIPLSINRRNPEPVKLRVLKRFTFTEEDSGYQWEKLRSAYMLAEWSEPYFNNRALFSDYYLTQRLTDTRLTPAWNEDVRPVGNEAYKHIIKARKNFSGQPEAAIRKGLYEPLFALLGFDFKVNKASDSAAEEADYTLFAKGDTSKPIALALTYVWNRNLDDVDTTREPEDGTPDEIPGAMVVSVLEKTDVPWVIVTNGKLWRLYSSTASNKATNYYEVDLEEAVAATNQITALKYWWLMFRQQAFTGFLDTLLTESDKYAKELGERLKEDVFLKIFPQFAKGFIADMRAKGLKTADIDLDSVFYGTMTFLYRMMFILYAESLELLPVNEERGYGELSLYTLKRELEQVAGENEADAPALLEKHYTRKSTDIYARLKQLFNIIDKGSVELNLPTYNGGLFSSENASGQFLEQYAIPDQYLMLGLDRLTRDEDDKTKKLEFIDFKSLGVRQLGSIYEGLLEFRVKIADQDLAVEKDGKRELYVPLEKAKKKNASVSVAKNDVYLQNDKQERKATGSYYTPDYIVKYIVQHTVGPVLDRKFAELEPRLRKVQRDYRDYAKLVEARRKSSGKDESPANFWNTDDMKQLVDDCLNVRVLDPAMGSGHFLVEVVDFISNRLINFLNGWSENPVWASLERIRDDILLDMERQHVTIDADRLTRVALLKRAVLKRCVYGVDLNQMAVELAKVSLWLDAFTLGAPLSFLDHHLKWGNSLIGARVADVQKALEGQLTLFSQSKFAGVMLATDLMQQVSYLSDNTIDQARKSKDAYRDASDHLAPYKRVLDVYTSRWFGNAPAKAKKGATAYDPTIEFLRRDDTQAWLEDPHNPKNRLPADDYMQAGFVAKTALDAAESKRFFHWELEFPEVFFAPSTPGGQNVKLREDGGFDAVVGNPPYVASVGNQFAKTDKDYFGSVFEGSEYQLDLYPLFMNNGIKFARESGYISFVVPNTWTKNVYSSKIRGYLLNKTQLISIVLIPSGAFDANVDTSVFVSEKTKTLDQNHSILVAQLDRNGLMRVYSHHNQLTIAEAESNIISTNLRESDRHILDKMFSASVTLDSIAKITRGVNPYDSYAGHTQEQIKNRVFHSIYKKDATFVPEIRGENIGRYSWDWDKTKWISYGEWLAAPRSPEFFENERIVLREIVSNTLLCAFVDENMIIDRSLYIALISGQNPKYTCAILNSNATIYYFRTFYDEFDELFPKIRLHQFKSLPIPRVDFTTPSNERERAVNTITGEYTKGFHNFVIMRVKTALALGQTDVVHDVLVHLAQKMIDLNKKKQAEVKRFLGWLEGKLRIAPKNDGSTGIDSLTGKTIIQGYLGDYQKTEAEVAWKDFFYRLHQNRNRFGAALSGIESEIEREFTASLNVLRPIKKQLSDTDTLIDKIVYQLYGLTDAEIELIERPQYEQALTEAKAVAIADETIKGETEEEKTEQVIKQIAEAILPAAQRYFERIDPSEVEAALSDALPKWKDLPPEAPTFLLTGDYNLRALPEHMDFSSSVIPYSKAVEVALSRLIFEPFRKSYQAYDVRNEFLQKYMRGEKELTLGNYMIILSSRSETALRNFASRIIQDVDSFAKTLNDYGMRDLRNKAAHDEVVSRDEADQTRTWAFQILRNL